MTLKDLRGVTDYDYSRAEFMLAWREFCDAVRLSILNVPLPLHERE